jgi:hypothetical protein
MRRAVVEQPAQQDRGGLVDQRRLVHAFEPTGRAKPLTGGNGSCGRPLRLWMTAPDIVGAPTTLESCD